MALVRNAFARGIKLTRQAAYTLVKAVNDSLGVPGPILHETKEKWGSFRVNMILPIFDHQIEANGVGGFMLPFAVPPLQEFCLQPDTMPPLDDTKPQAPVVFLDEFSLSLDQRCEPYGISADYAGSNDGKIDVNVVGRYNIEVTLQDKTPTLGDANAENVYPEREVFSCSIPAIGFAATQLRNNPAVFAKLNREVDPYKTLILQIAFPDLSVVLPGQAPSVTVSMRFRYKLQSRDTGAEIQNMPLHQGTRAAMNTNFAQPAAGSAMKADDATSGFAAMLRQLDQFLLTRLEGGYRKESDLPPPWSVGVADDVGAGEALVATACYDVIAVPLWTNFGPELALTANDANRAPYVGVAPYLLGTFDRRVIPIHFPFTVHHVLFAANYGKANIAGGTSTAVKPTSATWSMKVGVGLGRGIRADVFNYQPLAFLHVTNATRTDWLIDRIKQRRNGVLTTTPAGNVPFDSELFQVPIVRRAGESGRAAWRRGSAFAGTHLQGVPFFFGRGTNKTGGFDVLGNCNRSNAGMNGGGTNAPDTAGSEQFIEVRCEIRDTVGLGFGGGGAASSADVTYAGHSGHWVFIIGKKHLCDGTGDIPV